MSPCIGICTHRRKSGFCLGCKRTIDEIGRWPMLDDPERQKIIDQLPGRKIARLVVPASRGISAHADREAGPSARSAYRPLNTGLRFSRKADVPSL